MARDLADRDLQYLRLLAGQMARDAQALHDAIPAAGGREEYAAAGGIGSAIADLGELIHQYVLFWEDATPQERLEAS
jgi:hypothetical protein